MIFAVRAAVVLAFLVPAFVWGWLTPWWRTLGVAVVAFGCAEGIGRWLRHRRTGRGANVGLEVAVVALALAAATAASVTVLLRGAQPEPGPLPFVPVRTLVQDPGAHRGDQVRVHGSLKPGTHLVNPSSGEHRFVLEEAGGELRVRHVGVVPESLDDGSDVIVEGVLESDDRGPILRVEDILVPAFP